MNSYFETGMELAFQILERGGISQEGGGMVRDADTTIWLLNCEYVMAL